MMVGNWGPIDPDTPDDVRIKTGWTSEGEFTLVFSDEFNTDYRTFHPGDDPFWEAVDLHYWGVSALPRVLESVADLPCRRTTSNGTTPRQYDDLETRLSPATLNRRPDHHEGRRATYHAIPEAGPRLGLHGYEKPRDDDYRRF